MQQNKRKYLRLIFWLVLIVAGVILLLVRREAWFGNPAEAIYSVIPEPHNVVLTPGEDPTTERTISWRAGDTLAPSSVILLSPISSVGPDTIPAEGNIVISRSGQGAYYQVRLHDLVAGTYTYRVQTGEHVSAPYTFSISQSNNADFVIFGDMQYTSPDEAKYFFQTVQAAQTCPADAYMYVGDVIERPTDDYWQLFFHSIDSSAAQIPQVAALGNHEYLKGIRKRYDVRWPYIFVYPQNGPAHFLGRSYYIDYPSVRLIVLDTDGLQLPSDYMMLSTWLTQAVLYERVDSIRDHTSVDKWTVVMMHHPVYSAGMGRDNPLIFAAFHHALYHADLVIAGHDHNYARRRTHDLKHLVKVDAPEFTTPVFMVTSSSGKSYLPKCNPLDERIGSNHSFYSTLHVSPDSMELLTYYLPTEDSMQLDSTVTAPVLYDHLCFGRSGKYVQVTVGDSLPEELIELPERYQHKGGLSVRRFHNRLATRRKVQTRVEQIHEH